MQFGLSPMQKKFYIHALECVCLCVCVDTHWPCPQSKAMKISCCLEVIVETLLNPASGSI